MLRDLSKIIEKANDLGISEAELQAAAAALRADQFVWKDKHGHGRFFDVINTFPEYFEDLFEAFGDSFEINSNYGFCCIIPASTKPVLRLNETIFLLILAKMHDGEMRKGCVDFGRSKPSATLLLDEYEKLTGKKKPNEKTTKDALARLAKYGIIELGEMDDETKMRQITVLPSIMKVVSETFLEDLKELVSSDEPYPLIEEGMTSEGDEDNE
jgi:hypothetical protein